LEGDDGEYFEWGIPKKDLAGGCGGGGGGGKGGDGGKIELYLMNLLHSGTLAKNGGSTAVGNVGGNGYYLTYGVLLGGKNDGADGAGNGGDGGSGEYRKGYSSEDGEDASPGQIGQDGVVIIHYDDKLNADVQSYELDLTIDPYKGSGWIDGSNKINCICGLDGLNQFFFRLDDQLFIQQVIITDSSGPRPLNWIRLDEANVQVDLDVNYLVGDHFSITVIYYGYPDSSGDHGCIFTEHNGNKLVYTMNEPWFIYRWFPVKTSMQGNAYVDLDDKASAEFNFTVPEGNVVASNGLLQTSHAVADGWIQYHWLTNYELASYLYCFAVTNYHIAKLSYNGMPIEIYIYPEDIGHLNEWTDRLPYMLDTYIDLYGPYPFASEKYGVAQIPEGGMEYATMTFLAGKWSQTYHGRPRSEMCFVHELAHQWWGDSVTCKTWNDIWLNEGFATYSEALWIQKSEYPQGYYGDEAYHDYMTKLRFDPFQFPGGIFPDIAGETIYRYDVSDAEEVLGTKVFKYVYLKAAWVLHMLRHFATIEEGDIETITIDDDSQFFDILALYRSRFEYSSASTEDFQQAAEDVYGVKGISWLSDLSWFFEEWIYESGAPKYKGSWYPLGLNKLVLNIYQVQQTLFPSDTLFSMPIDVVYWTMGSPQKRVIFNIPGINKYYIDTTGLATKVSVDPENWILQRLWSNPPGSGGGANNGGSAPGTPGGAANSLPEMAGSNAYQGIFEAD